MCVLITITNIKNIMDKSKGMWWVENKFSSHFKKPSILEDVAYYLYCKDRTETLCNPQITFLHFSDNKMNKEYLNKAERILKINKIIKTNNAKIRKKF